MILCDYSDGSCRGYRLSIAMKCSSPSVDSRSCRLRRAMILINVRTVGHRKLADHMVAQYGLRPGNLRVIYAGTDMGRIENSLSQRRGRLHEMCRVNPETPIISFVGRFTAQKRPDVFVRSVAKLLELQPQSVAHFAMIGDGTSRPAVEHLIASSA